MRPGIGRWRDGWSADAVDGVLAEEVDGRCSGDLGLLLSFPLGPPVLNARGPIAPTLPGPLALDLPALALCAFSFEGPAADLGVGFATVARPAGLGDAFVCARLFVVGLALPLAPRSTS